MQVAVDAVNSVATVNLKQNQFDALVDLTFNLGAGALEHSTLLKMLNAIKYDYKADRFLAPDPINGHMVASLLRRRPGRNGAIQ